MQRLIESINSMPEFMWNNIFTVINGMSLKEIFEEIKAEKS